MKILVIGANGRTGRLVVEQGLRRGHEITAFTRHPEALKSLEGQAGLKIVKGDALDFEAVTGAVAGQDTVISAVGTSGIASNLLKAMTAGGVRRLVMTSSRSVVATSPKWIVSLVWWFFRPVYADLARAEGMLEVSGLDYSIVRATMLNDKPFGGQVHTDFEANATGGDWQLSRADYAMTLLDVAENPGMIGKAVGVCGVKPSRKKALAAAQ